MAVQVFIYTFIHVYVCLCYVMRVYLSAGLLYHLFVICMCVSVLSMCAVVHLLV